MKKKTIIIIVSLVIAALLVVGLIFFFWKKNASEENFDPRGEFGDEYVDPESGYSTWNIIFPPASSEERAKEEFVKAVWRFGGKKGTEEATERELVKNSKRINFSEIRKWEKELSSNPLEEENLEEKTLKKYQQSIFKNLPDQSKFTKGIEEADFKNFVLGYSAEILELKPTGEIDWIASLEMLQNGRAGVKGHLKSNQQTFQKTSDYIKNKLNKFLLDHGKQFPHLTNLKELNEWMKTLSRAKRRGQTLLYKRWKAAKKIGEKYGRTGEAPKGSKWEYKNQKFNLTYPLSVFFTDL